MLMACVAIDNNSLCIYHSCSKVCSAIQLSYTIVTIMTVTTTWYTTHHQQDSISCDSRTE